MRSHELGKIQPGYYADCILVDGNPLEDIAVLQDHDKLNIILINGRVHKAGRREYIRDGSGGLTAADETTKRIAAIDLDFPEVKKTMQKNY